jgi:hypothetical protein
VRCFFSLKYLSLMRVHLVLITSDEKTIIDDVRLHLNPSLCLHPLTCFQELKIILVDPLPIGCNLLVGSSSFRVGFCILICRVRLLQAIIDTCHSGTMLDLPHYHCNDVYVPWQSKGERRTMTMQNING